MKNTDNLLEVKNVIKHFEDFVAVNDVSFVAKKGEFITLLGPSGCGKTTLLKSIGGFFSDLTSGIISIDGEVVNSIPPEKRDTVMCFQSYALFPHLTIFKNVAFGLEQKKHEKAEINKRVLQTLKQVDLSSQISKLPSELSGGQQQRVALARAMVVQPKVILFDEPLSNLDAKLREQVRFQIKKLQQEMNFTAVYVTHDQQEALALSDKIIVMNKGKIQQEGTPQNIYNHPSNTFIANFVGNANIMKTTITDNKNTTYTLKTPIGTLITEVKEQQAKKPNSNTVFVGWRPESITFTKSSHNNVQAIINEIAFLGNCVLVSAYIKNKIDSGETYILLEIPPSFNAKKGETISFSILPEKLFFLENYDE